MDRARTICVYEFGSLQVGEAYNGVEFRADHLDLLSRYITLNPKPQIFSLLHKRVKFASYVGVIKAGDITIEVLPKTDRHQEKDQVWQSVLINMLAVSLDVKANTTTDADIQMRRHSVLETYIQLFIDEVTTLVHHGLLKKYRQSVGNQNALKGRLLIHQHISKNRVHAERFYVRHTVYDRDNAFNFIISEALECIKNLNVSSGLNQSAVSLLINFPECKPVGINEKLFQRLIFDRKTDRYKRSIGLAQTILLNFHPDLKGGANSILAIMFDMSLLWENYVYWMLRRASGKFPYEVLVRKQQSALFWQHPDRWNLRLRPDLLIQIEKEGKRMSFILDTKWKYRSDTSIEDVRQMYAYLQYFPSDAALLVYPDNLMGGRIKAHSGKFHNGAGEFLPNMCGLAFLDLLADGKLDPEIGVGLIEELARDR